MAGKIIEQQYVSSKCMYIRCQTIDSQKLDKIVFFMTKSKIMSIQTLKTAEMLT